MGSKKKKVPSPRKSPEPKKGCSHSTTKRVGPLTVTLPKGPHKYYQVWCTDKCKAWLRNEDA